jgi:hypothetical protein
MRIERLRAGSILRAVLFAAVLAALGLAVGAAAPTTAMADDDDDDGPSVSSNFHQCSGGTKTADNPATPAFEQICTINQPSGTCVQRSKEPVVVQMCLVNQGPTPPVMGTARNNNLVVIQIADQRGAEASATAPLDATQIVDGPLPHTALTRGEQRNFGTANNNAVITQVIIQKLKSGIDDDDDGDDDDDNGEKDEDDDGKEDDDNGEENGPPDLLIEQFEQAHQWVDLCQGGVPCGTTGTPPNPTFTGRNRSVVFQSHDQVELAANAATIQQGQNVEDRDNTCSPGPPVGGTQDPEARACYTIQQDTGNTTNNASNPANFSRLTQHAAHLQNARNCDPCVGGHQAQGHSPTFGGIDHNFVQNAPGIARLFSVQVEDMTQRRNDTGAMTHHQVGHIRKGSGTQNTNANNLVDIFQEKTQYTGEGLSVQQGSAQAFAQTSGTCVADLFVNQNEQSAEAHESGSNICNEFVFCEFDAGCESSDDIDLLAVRP